LWHFAEFHPQPQEERILMRVAAVIAVLLSILMGVEQSIAEESAVSRPPLELRMSNQFGETTELRNLRGAVVALVIADKEGAQSSQELGHKLHVFFHPDAEGKPPMVAARAAVKPVAGHEGLGAPEVKVIPVAVIGKVPSLIRPVVRVQFRRASPEVPVWLDLNDTVRTRIGLTAGVPNVLVVDANGFVRGRYTKFETEQDFQSLAEAIEIIRLETIRLASRPEQ
jgi:hypothetical protein